MKNSRDSIVPFDFHEVMALAAPKPLFNYSARQDAIFPNAQMIAAAGRQVASVYGLYGAADRYQFVMGDGPHDFPPAIREQAYTFLDRWAKNAPSR